MNATNDVTPVPAASLILVRDGARGIEVLMMARHQRSGFAAGAVVFPGGRIDAADSALAARCRGCGEIGAFDLSARVTAIRETWEECGILLAHRRGDEGLISRAQAMRLGADPATPFAALLAAREIELAADRLIRFAHWITPPGPKRFDTHFYLGAFDCDQEACHDGHEAVDARWLRPAEAVEEGDAGRLHLMFVTRMNLLKLARAGSVAAALEAARRESPVTVMPEVVMGACGPAMRIPIEAGYGTSEVPVSTLRHL